MPIVPADTEGLRRADRALTAGRPVILPLPTPLPYVVAGEDAGAVNLAKGRPAEQPAGMALADFALAAPHVALDAGTLELARRLTAEQGLNLLLPVRDDPPAWMRPSISHGHVGVTLVWLDRLRPLLRDRGHLYLSSGNRTGGEVAVTAAAADAAFAGALLVVDGDAYRDPAVASGSATMVRVGPGGNVDVVRRGVQDASITSQERSSSTTTPP
jgi:tRNA A37 threonylcarbamoyladenosine synthetase subunit TsaC/SUA5/YrdC